MRAQANFCSMNRWTPEAGFSLPQRHALIHPSPWLFESPLQAIAADGQGEVLAEVSREVSEILKLRAGARAFLKRAFPFISLVRLRQLALPLTRQPHPAVPLSKEGCQSSFSARAFVPR